MTWPFENNTNGIVKNLAKRNLKSEKRRNVMVIISVVLAAFLISLSGLAGVSLMQTEKKKVIDTYEARHVYRDFTWFRSDTFVISQRFFSFRLSFSDWMYSIDLLDHDLSVYPKTCEISRRYLTS